MFNSLSGHHCPRCNKRVYFAEEVIALSKHWHKSCFLCANEECRKRLDSGNCADHDGEAYCKYCHMKMFGPRGYGFGIGAGILSTSDSGSCMHNGRAAKRESLPPSSAYAVAQAAPLIAEYGRRNSSPSNPNSRAALSPRPFGYEGKSPVKMERFFGPNDVCSRCKKLVYQAERIIAAGSAWHKLTCFTCAACNKHLESTTLCENNHDIYCTTCYGRNFGPKGYGYGMGAGTLAMQQ